MSSRRELFDPNDRTLRQFAAIWIFFFGAIAFREAFGRNRPVIAFAVLLIALGVGLIGLAWPRRIRPVFVGWMTAAYPIGWVVSKVVLGIVFYGIMTPGALILRLIGHDALVLKRQPAASTYWHSKPAAADEKQYLHQY
jgi:hypothetical protein